MSQVASAPAAAGMKFTTEQIFGLLIFREQGKSVAHISALVDLPESDIDAALAQGAAGAMPRVPAACGSGLRIQEDRRNQKSQALAYGGIGELFLPRWQRAILRKLCSNGGIITVAGANALRSTYADGSSASLAMLEHGLKTARIPVRRTTSHGEHIYQLDDAGLARLRAIIANRWQGVAA